MKKLFLLITILILALAVGAIGGRYVGSTMGEFKSIVKPYEGYPFKVVQLKENLRLLSIHPNEPIMYVFLTPQGPTQVFQVIDGEHVLVWDGTKKIGVEAKPAGSE